MAAPAAAVTVVAAVTLAVVMWVEDQVAAVMSGAGRQVEVTLEVTVEDILEVLLEVWGMAVRGIRHSVP